MDKELLHRFFNGSASVGEEEQVLDWVEEDSSHRREMLSERRLFDAVLMHGDGHKARRGRNMFALPRWTREFVKYAAVILVAIGIGRVYVTSLYNKAMLAHNTISVPAGQRVDVVLPDGTKVCMNALSELKYPTLFGGKYRKVQLTGEAFFEVAHDDGHPFIVETYACDVEVLGTKFDVEARPANGEFITSLVEGSVRVTDRENRNIKIELTPKQQVHRLNGRLVVGQIPEHEGFAWRDGLIAFRDASFMELIREFEKYYGVKIDVQRKDVSRNMFTGKIRISEGLDHALWVLQRSADFKFVRNETKDSISIQ